MKLPAYADYSPSDTDWFGDLPKHWDSKRLKYTCRRADQKVEADEETPLPYVGLEHIESWTGRLRPLDSGLVPNGISSRFRAGDTLFGKLRPYLAKACNVDFDGLCSSELLVLRTTGYNRRFLLYMLLTNGFIAIVDQSTYGAKMPRANWDYIGSCALPVPPTDEQLSIADFLDRETAKIDNLLGKKRQLIERLREKRSALITQAVTRGLPLDAARTAGLVPNPKLRPPGIQWLGDTPEHWSVMQLKRAVTFQRGHDLPTDERQEGEIPVVSSAGVSSKHNRAAAKGPGIVTGRYGTIGQFYLVNDDYWPLNTTLYSIDLHGNEPRFLRYMLEKLSPLFLLNAVKSAVPGIDRNDVHPIQTAIPPLPEQVAIADYLDRETVYIDGMIGTVETAIERLEEYRAALITAAVTGKIDVRGSVT